MSTCGGPGFTPSLKAPQWELRDRLRGSCLAVGSVSQWDLRDKLEIN